MTQFTVGCDPEFFVQAQKAREPASTTSKTKSQAQLYKALISGNVPLPATSESKEKVEDDIIPICGHLGGTKETPAPITELGAGYAVQEDGIAAEFNIPPCSTAFEFGNALSTALSHIEYKMLAPKGFQRSYTNNLTLKPEWVEKFPNIGVIGCDPDFCAYEEKDGLPVSRILDTAAVAGVRGAGGHLHLGYPVAMCRPEIMVKLLDVVLGLQFLGNDKQGARRPWWGLAGLYRPKPYGVEYRTMSNWWIWRNSNAKLVAGNALALLESISGHIVEWSAAYNAIDWQQVKRVIDTEDHKTAHDLWVRYQKMFPILQRVAQVGMEKAVWTPPEPAGAVARPRGRFGVNVPVAAPMEWVAQPGHNIVQDGRAEADQVE